ncbi:hypothetical protein L596_011956 [Steinernema carpocapsae]|uniref:Uncharacterized protein n=1 Tax=Steinernema carpocapsae TaxID=34508 RepID=A0A4U5NVZ1_STECR|nr:hypothetical protein L596_011956 [Steinernema carpocapsae]
MGTAEPFFNPRKEARLECSSKGSARLVRGQVCFSWASSDRRPKQKNESPESPMEPAVSRSKRSQTKKKNVVGANLQIAGQKIPRPPARFRTSVEGGKRSPRAKSEEVFA